MRGIVPLTSVWKWLWGVSLGRALVSCNTSGDLALEAIGQMLRQTIRSRANELVCG